MLPVLPHSFPTRRSSDLLLSDFVPPERFSPTNESFLKVLRDEAALIASGAVYRCSGRVGLGERLILPLASDDVTADGLIGATHRESPVDLERSEEHTSELQSLMRNSYAVFCMNKK